MKLTNQMLQAAADAAIAWHEYGTQFFDDWHEYGTQFFDDYTYCSLTWQTATGIT